MIIQISLSDSEDKYSSGVHSWLYITNRQTFLPSNTSHVISLRAHNVKITSLRLQKRRRFDVIMMLLLHRVPVVIYISQYPYSTYLMNLMGQSYISSKKSFKYFKDPVSIWFLGQGVLSLIYLMSHGQSEKQLSKLTRFLRRNDVESVVPNRSAKYHFWRYLNRFCLMDNWD